MPEKNSCFRNTINNLAVYYTVLCTWGYLSKRKIINKTLEHIVN